jgi:rhodanese-related sulfurtransferase
MGIFGNIFGGNSNNGNLATLVNDGAFLVDVRTPGEFAEGNVKGSVNIPLDQVQNQLAKFKAKENIVVFCRSGNRSGQAKSILEQNGFTNVTNGGTWQDVNAVINK